MCEKITIDGEDYYTHEDLYMDTDEVYYSVEENSRRIVKYTKHISDGYLGRPVLATTDTSLQCPQVVNYAEYLAESHYGTEIDSYRSSNPFDLEGDRKQGFVKGYQQHSETHSLGDEEVIMFAKYAIDTDIVSYEKSLQQFKSTLPTKIYYR